MEIEQQKTIKEKEFKISQLKDLKIIELDVKNGEDDFPFLEENLKDVLEEELKKNKLKFDSDLKIYFDLGYSQGSGVMFEGIITTDKAEFKIKHIGHYYHYNSKEIELIKLFEKNKEIYIDEFNKRQDKKAEKLEEEFNILYKEICKKIEKMGYEIIENTQEENILRSGFDDFLTQNEITEIELFDIDYKTEHKKGYVMVCSEGNTNIKGLWIKDFTLKRVYESIVYKPIIRETTTIKY